MSRVLNWIWTLFNHRKIIDNLEKEATKDFEVKVKEFHAHVGSVDATIESPFLSAFVDHLIAIYEANGGDNYLSMSVMRKGEPYEFIIQRKFGKTPPQLVSELKKENEELKEQLENQKTTKNTP